MAQINSGLRACLSQPLIYRLFSDLVGARRLRKLMTRDYLTASPGDRILDIGCGTADILAHLPPVDYTGYDLSQSYIMSARRQFADRGRFICEAIDQVNLVNPGQYDWVLAFGVLHHLDDAEARKLFEIGRTALKPGGRMLTIDGVLGTGHSPMADWLISHDRGKNIRTEEAYTALARPFFPSCQAVVRTDLLRIPYVHLLLHCQK